MERVEGPNISYILFLWRSTFVSLEYIFVAEIFVDYFI